MFSIDLRRLVSAKNGIACISALGIAVLSHTAAAVPFANPQPAAWLNDIDGDGYFETNGVSVAFELYDGGDSVSEFGFYEQGNSGTLIPIFEADDNVGDSAVISFIDGFVIDFDLLALQNQFTAPVNAIGFYMSFPSFVIFSDPTLNAENWDFMAAYPVITQSGFLDILFHLPDSLPSNIVAIYRVSGVESVSVPTPSSIPAPSSIALMVLGLAIMYRRKILK
jgi:hypothetical protein